MKELLQAMLEATPRLARVPRRFGVFHMVSLVVIAALAVLLILFRRRLPRGEVSLRWALVIYGVGLLLLEVGKQIVFSYDPMAGWQYEWSRFPFQFCSTPIYAALVAMCLKDTPLRRSLLCFLATYAPVAGVAVLAYPAGNVFHEILFLDVHTMVWHGGMLLFGLYLWLTGTVTPTLDTARRSAAVFLPLTPVAVALNEAAYAWGFAAGYDFNMFYVGRLGRCRIPVLSTIQAECPYPVFVLSYMLALGLGGLAVTLAAVCWSRLCRHRREKHGEKP